MTQSIEEKILQELAEIKTMILANKKVLSAEEAAQYLGISKSGLYRMTSTGAIPHYKPTNGTLFFNRDELTEWALSAKKLNPLTEADKLLSRR